MSSGKMWSPLLHISKLATIWLKQVSSFLEHWPTYHRTRIVDRDRRYAERRLSIHPTGYFNTFYYFVWRCASCFGRKGFIAAENPLAFDVEGKLDLYVFGTSVTIAGLLAIESDGFVGELGLEADIQVGKHIILIASHRHQQVLRWPLHFTTNRDIFW